MQKIIPHLWFDKEAREAAAFYTSVFPESKVTYTSKLEGTPSGDCDVVGFELWQQEFMAISAGPLFKFNPSTSFMVNYDPLQFDHNADAAKEALDAAWEKLSEGGKVLMALDAYPFSKRYGWLEDKYGLSWQLMLTDPAGEPRPAIVPCLLFTGNKAGKAEEAIHFYLSVFKNSQQGSIHHYPAGAAPGDEGNVAYADFRLEDTWFAVMDSSHEHGFDFNEAISFLVTCTSQEEIDYYFEKLSAVPESEECGWLKDKYGLSWQISPEEMEIMFSKGNQEDINRVMKVFLQMKKPDIGRIKAAMDKE